MKIYISVDIEGITGITHWDEADETKAGYAEFRERMTSEALAACEGAVAAGAEEILVKDAHGNGRNIFAERLPRCARLVRGWSGSPLLMVQELDASCDALAFVGYHSAAASGGNPLAHTLSSSAVASLRVNGERVSEFHLHAFAAADLGVPTVFVSGDEALCAEVAATRAEITTVATMRGVGNSTIGRHPALVREEIRAGVESALRGDLRACLIRLPERFLLQVEYHQTTRAHAMSHYPGAALEDDRTVRLEMDQYQDLLRALSFIV